MGREVLTYSNGMAQAPHLLHVKPLAKKLVENARTMATKLAEGTPPTYFIAYRKQGTLGGLPKVVQQPAATFLQEHVEEGILVHLGSSW